MPPKKQGQAPSKKTVEKKKEKIIEDKTFGIKNKKGKKQQTYIKQVTNQVKFGGQQSIAKREADAYQLKKEKAEKEKEKADMEALFKPVAQVQKISAGADPKSVLCLFFKQGHCTKGDKCKFSHDLSLENKAEKRSIYVDSRDIDLEEDTIDKWDTDKLKEVVTKKHSAKTKTKTEIVCKHFLHAIDKGIYGWFWECPSGGDKCIYRHALPPGFVLKKQQKEQEELQPQDTITLDQLVENERAALISSRKALTQVTLESFRAWKKRKLQEKREKAADAIAKKKEAFKQGKTLGISGREMFTFNPELVGGDDEDPEGGDVVLQEALVGGGVEGEEEEGEGQEVVVDVTSVDFLTSGAEADAPNITTAVKSEGEASSEPGAGGGNSEDGVQSERGVAAGCVANAEADIPVDEGLFLEEEGGVADLDEGEVPSHKDDNDVDTSQKKQQQQPSMPPEEEVGVAVDESLFDLDNLQDLNLDDPAILEADS